MKRIIFVLLLFFFLVFSCQMEENLPSEGTIVLTIDSANDLSLNSDSEIIFSIYGYDSGIADAPATLLQTTTVPITSLPQTIELPYTDTWNSLIEPNRGSESDFNYYLALGTDDIDETILVTDYQATNNGDGPKFTDHLSKLSQTIYIKYQDLNSSLSSEN